MVLVISYNLTNFFITFNEIMAVEIGSLNFQFLKKPARRALFMFKVMAEIIFPNLFVYFIPAKNGRRRLTYVFSGVIKVKK